MGKMFFSKISRFSLPALHFSLDGGTGDAHG